MSTDPATLPVQPGDVLAGKYLIERVLGAGGMGVVVAAKHTKLDQHVAIKFLLPKALENAQVVGRFAREARAAARINSEHVARVIDVGELPNGAPYIVMEYLRGEDLSQRLAARGPLPVGEVADAVLQASDGLAVAHAAGIVHRDLKPANLFLAERPGRPAVVKVLDFGISKLTSGDPQDEGLTKTSALMGSPYYMSPEQLVSAKSVDFRTDVWSLGIVLYELLVGSTPFVCETLPEIVGAILQNPAPPPSARRPGLPPELDRIVLRCLEKSPAARFQSVAELAHALAPFAPSAGARVSMSQISSAPTEMLPSIPQRDSGAVAQSNQPGASTAQAWEESRAGGPRRSWVAPVGVGVVLLLGVGLGALAMRSRWGDSSSSSSSTPTTISAAPSVVPIVAMTAEPVQVFPSVDEAPTARPGPSATLAPTHSNSTGGTTHGVAKPANEIDAGARSPATAPPFPPPPAALPPAAAPPPPKANPMDIQLK